MDNTTIVFSSSRAIRHEQLKNKNQTLFLPSYITMSEFISKLCIVHGYKYIDDDSRILLLLQASDFKAFEKLQIERNFFTFTKNSSYIFKFFEELSAELYDINNLRNADLYAEYEEHITILEELYHRYEALCNEKKVLDKIFLPKLYSFNQGFLKATKSVTINLDGYLTNFEIELLEQTALQLELQIRFFATPFNHKMQQKFEEFGFELQSGYEYLLNLTTKAIIAQTKIETIKNVSCESFSEDLLQIAFIKKKVYEFIQKRHEPEKIAVILPNESKAELLKSFDEKSNFNFAMGSSFKQSKIYTLLDANVKALEQDSQENTHRSRRFGRELTEIILEMYAARNDFKVIEECFYKIREFIGDKTELKIYDQELYSFLKVLPFMQDMGSKSILNLFMQRLAKSSIDDVRGGKITVMGVLESRGIAFDGVIIVDFNEGVVPKKSDKDMFLNTKIREYAQLPTMNDRENLQKHYYNMLILNAKEVAISYVKSADANPSRFLKQLHINETKNYDEHQYASVLFQRNTSKEQNEENIVVPYSFRNQKLSNTKLKTYLTCKRKFYLQYVQRLNDHKIPKDIPEEYEIGDHVHRALCSLYTKKSFYSDLNELQRDLEKELDSVCEDNEFIRYQIAMQKKILEKFCKTEIKRFAEGYSVLATEKPLEVEYEGVILSGIIDRVDVRDGELSVLDYKTGSYAMYTKNSVTEATDFQLEFYTLLASKLGNVSECGFYDLKECKIVNETFLDEKMALLQANIKDLLMVESIEVEKCEDTKNCLYCPYKIMCGRE
ncbi:PD-(D/E)XK nuclease family protein [Sulfurimonas sp. C5]|uniref:PD-(D/E)XK nuclease family protein n=1 Tax=Sulfurimonas sp. C5 TaxID=3036947 RepID=UPI0024565C46|nr:PD-(D/E)XK nuclease family protein [Sulfurimonas sp. C5]MDH4944393.1 PD-(D/E)XK nuclease family protein [Sulfurimonas sp. C5]